MRRKIVNWLLTLAILLGTLAPAVAQAAVPAGFTGISGSYTYVAGRKVKTPAKQLTTVSRYDSVTAMAYKYTTVELNGKIYAITGAGKLKKNMILGVGDDMYYYDADGARVEDPAVRAAVQFVKEHGGRKTRPATKLRNCFNYLAKTSVYPAVEDTSSANFANERLTPAAIFVLKEGRTGDSFVKAAALANVAKVLGYEAQVSACRLGDDEGGYTPHGYTYIKQGRSWYIYDTAKNLYKKTLKKYPFTTYGPTESLTLSVKNGMTCWEGTVDSMKNVLAHTPEAEDARTGMRLVNGTLMLNGEKFVGQLTMVPAARSVDNRAYMYYAVRLDGQEYVFDENAQLITDRIVGMGSYMAYYGKDGAKVVDPLILKAVDYVKLYGGTGNTRYEKLKKCYLRISDRTYYSHDPDHTAALCTPDLLPTAANKMIGNPKKGCGNCFGWASAFAYIGRVLGYDTEVLKTRVILADGTYGPHGLTHILDQDGKWKVCDANIQYRKDCWMKVIGGTPKYGCKTITSDQTYFELYTSGSEAHWRQR